MNMNDYDVIYNDAVYKAISIEPDYSKNVDDGINTGVHIPKFLNVFCIDTNGNMIAVYDESFMFRFIRKERVK